MTIALVRNIHANTYTELANATLDGPTEVNGELQFKYVRAVGAKG